VSLDLNLLRTFLSIYERRSLTRAAADLHVTQPSVTYALNLLRSALSDPLFIRSGRRMEPTPRADALYGVARETIDNVDAIVDQSEFAPATSTARFRLSLTDMGEYLYLPPLMERLAREAPAVSIDVIPLDSDALDEWMLRDEIDVAISSAPATGRVPWRVLFEETYVCVAVNPPAGHGARLTDEDLRDMRFVVIDPTAGHSRAYGSLAAATGRENAILKVHHLATLPETLVRGDLAAIVPSRIGRSFARRWPLQVRALPPAFTPFEVNLFSGAGTGRSEARRWFVELITDTLRRVAGEPDHA